MPDVKDTRSVSGRGANHEPEERRYLPFLDADLRLSDGRTLAYSVWGDPHGRPVLLFHGSPSSRLFCPDPAVTAASGVRLVTVDRPGYGRSQVQANRRILDWAADTEQLADALGMPQFAVVAHSSGGPYALACAVLLPGRVTGVALVSCVVPLDECPPARASLDEDDRRLVDLARRDPVRASAVIAAGAAWLAQDPDRFLTLPRPEPDALLLQDPAVRAMFLSAVRESVRSGLDGYAWDEVLERQPWGFGLGDVAVNVALWHGDQDAYIPRSHVEAAAATLPHCLPRFHADEGHGLILSRWADIVSSIRP